MEGPDNIQGLIRPSERPFMRRVDDWLVRVGGQSTWLLTDFLTPREQFVLKRMCDSRGLVVSLYGGAEQAERKRARIMPEEWYPEPTDFEISQLRVSTEDKDVLTHGAVLGSLLGTGIERRRVGDIAVSSHLAFVLVCADIVPYLRSSWVQVGRAHVSLEVTDESVQLLEPAYVRDVISVSSLRADAVIAQACHWSRGKAQEAIERGAVTMNYVELTKSDEPVTIGDILSIRGFGRIRVYEFLGETKSQRQRLEVGVLSSKSSS